MAWIFASFLCFLPLIWAQQDLTGLKFFSLNCGGVGPDFPDASVPDINWQSDNNFIYTGLPAQITNNVTTDAQLRTLRHFPAASSPAKNCYEFPVDLGNIYLVRAGFLYANYDGLQSSTISFQTALDSTPWDDVVIDGASSVVSYHEAITAPTVDTNLSVCLIRQGTDTPFINTLEIRELLAEGYTFRFAAPIVLRLHSRINFGERQVKSPMRYPYDPYDRLWPTDLDMFPDMQGTPIQAPPGQVINVSRSMDHIPSAVMRTALSGPNLSYSRPIPPGADLYTVIWWSELNGSLGATDRRIVDASDNIGQPAVEDLTTHFGSKPFQTLGLANFTYYAENQTFYAISVTRDENSTLDAIINADELYLLQPVVNGTDPKDVEALIALKDIFNLEQWVGDPCSPVSWDEIGCSKSQVPNAILKVTSLNLSGKKLNGTIPSVISRISALKDIDLSNNNFSGQIPDGLQQLQSLSTLNVSYNQLSGSLELWMESLVSLDVRNNSLNGTFPSGLISILGTGFRYSGNPLLQCVPTNNLACPAAPGPSQQNTVKSKSSSLGPKVGGSVGAVVAVAAVIIGVSIWYTKCGPKTPALSGQSQAVFSGGPVNRQAVIVATRNFSDVIGDGSFGPVYHGLFSQNQQEVAVKVVAGRSDGFSELLKEVVGLSRIHHPNLVGLLGYYHDSVGFILLSEFMPGGDLKQRLYGSRSSPPLEWEQRVKAALDVARGLDYLHNTCKPSIIHQDVKTSNVLLNTDATAKLADVGLFRWKPVKSTGVSGYLDPEYEQLGKLTEKSDVYSFGVVLMEVICGRPPIGPQRPEHIAQLVESAVQRRRIDGIVDPALGQKYPVQSASRLAHIALMCTKAKGSERPNMTWVVSMLAGLAEAPLPP